MNLPAHKDMLELARRACADSPDNLRALDAIDRAWNDSPELTATALTWRQIEYLAQEGIDLNIEHPGEPMRSLEKLANTKRPDDVL